MSADAAAAAYAFSREVFRRRAEEVVAFPWGELYVTPSLPLVYDANFALALSAPDGAGALVASVENEEAAAGLGHRKLVVQDAELATAVWPALSGDAWPMRDRYLVMAQLREPDRPSTVPVAEVELEQIEAIRAAADDDPAAPSDLGLQLRRLDERLAASMEVRVYAAHVDNEPASCASLYLDGRVAQIEDVATLERHRGNGLARAVVLHAAAEARAAGAEVVFLYADETDWPRELYAKLGFDVVATEHVAVRPGP